MLVVFLNSLITFDEVELYIYNSILDENNNDSTLKLNAGKLIFDALLYNYLKNKKRSKTAYFRILIMNKIEYNAKEFKLYRM